ncbi:MAG: HAD-IIB family hydrolase [Lentisphaeria bacterium]|nr:HAD-IIB family hydrolase [Lentisphaeria bacterium]
MKQVKKYIIFTDLDGTLLDHDTYSWDAAKTALKKIKDKQIPLIFNTSKTLDEIKNLQEKIGINGPFVAENGGVIAFKEDFAKDRKNIKKIGEHYCFFLGKEIHFILDALHDIRQRTGLKFKGFHDMDTKEIAKLCNFSEEEAKISAQRTCSEPLIWLDDEIKVGEFIHILTQYGLRLTKGGRFYHVMGDNDKGRAVRWLMHTYSQLFPMENFQSIGLGDGENDRRMLNTVDYAIVIPSFDKQIKVFPDNPNKSVAKFPGPKGWNQSLMEILKY